jgi:hypothetical protein
MGVAKNLSMDNDGKYQIAIDLCKKVNAITECADHGELIDSGEYTDPKELAEIITKEFQDVLNNFDDEEDLIETIQLVLNDTADECSSCENIRNS